MVLSFQQGVIGSLWIILAVGGAIFGTLQDDASEKKSPLKSAPEWADYNPPGSDATAYAKILTERQPFGEPIVVPGVPVGVDAGSVNRPAGPPPLQWRVGAIVTAENSRYLVLLLRRPGEIADKAEIRHLGESLPDGGVIHALGADHFTVDQQGRIQTIKMFSQK